MSPLRSLALLALAVAVVSVHACEDAERDPPPAADPTGGAPPAGTAGAPGGPAPTPVGTGGRAGGVGAPTPPGTPPGGGMPMVNACPPNAAGTPCGGGSPVCVQPSDGGGVSGCLCLQSMWMCGSFPVGGGGGGGPARDGG